jgi:hypothetical protein
MSIFFLGFWIDSSLFQPYITLVTMVCRRVLFLVSTNKGSNTMLSENKETKLSEDDVNAFFDLHVKFQELSAGVVAAKATGRLIMTDDIIQFSLVREKAVESFKQNKDLFFFGIALPAAVQDQMDAIIREHKQTLVRMIKSDVAHEYFDDIRIDSNNPGGVWLVSVRMTKNPDDAFGFFLNTNPTKPRRVWQPKPQSTEVLSGAVLADKHANGGKTVAPALPAKQKPALLASSKPMVVKDTPVVKQQKTAPVKRRKQFETIRMVTS